MAHLPSGLQQWLDTWGLDLRARITDAVTQHGLGIAGVPVPVKVGTDCSGIEAPIHALSGLKVPHCHCWSSELEDGPRKVLLANTAPTGQVYRNVLESKVQSPEYVHLYVSGFSCKPFSTLHNQSKLLDEPEARIFWSVVDRILRVRPACFVLENVKGIVRVRDKVLEALRQRGFYNVAYLRMDPSELAEPIQRPRIYFFGVRKDVARLSEQQLQKVLTKSWEAVTAKGKVRGPTSMVPLSSRLLPSSHPAVAQYQQFRRDRWLQAGDADFTMK